MINNLKDLEKLLTLLNKKGVERIKLGDLELQIDLNRVLDKKPTLNIANEAPNYPPGIITEDSKIPLTDSLTPEQLLYWSAGTTDAN